MTAARRRMAAECSGWHDAGGSVDLQSAGQAAGCLQVAGVASSDLRGAELAAGYPQILMAKIRPDGSFRKVKYCRGRDRE